MIFKNTFTTPTGRQCQLQQMCNEEYMILVKYLQNDDYKNFYNCLFEFVKRDIPDFDECDIVEKCYIWFALCLFSIRCSIEVNNSILGSQEVFINQILDNLESQYIADKTVDYKINDNYVLTFGYPTSFYFDEGYPIIDFYSGLKKLNNENITDEQKQLLRMKLPTKHISAIEGILRQNFNHEVDLLDGVPMNALKINAFGEGLLANVISFYRMPLDVFYKMMYASIRHMRMSYSDYMKVTPIEVTILLKEIAEENRQEAEQAKKGNLNTISNIVKNND